jgi:hypothetical protein
VKEFTQQEILLAAVSLMLELVEEVGPYASTSTSNKYGAANGSH